VFQEYVDTVKARSKRVDGLDTQLESAASESVFWPVIEGLVALRGVNLLTATTVVTEIGDLKRFASVVSYKFVALSFVPIREDEMPLKKPLRFT
jgi:hypothetical protein